MKSYMVELATYFPCCLHKNIWGKRRFPMTLSTRYGTWTFKFCEWCNQIQGRGPGGLPPSHFQTKLRPKGPKKNFWRPPPALSQSLDLALVITSSPHMFFQIKSLQCCATSIKPGFFILGKLIVLFPNHPRFCRHVRRIQKSVPDAIFLIFERTGAMPGSGRIRNQQK